MTYTNDEYNTYLKVKHALLLEDARAFVTDYLADERGCEPWDIDDEVLAKYDYDYLVEEYEHKEDCNWAFNDTWKNIVADYMEDFEE